VFDTVTVAAVMDGLSLSHFVLIMIAGCFMLYGVFVSLQQITDTFLGYTEERRRLQAQRDEEFAELLKESRKRREAKTIKA